MAATDRRFTLPSGAKTRLYRGRVIAPSAPLKATPKTSVSLDTELIFGQGFDVYAEAGAWLLGRAVPLVPSKRKAYVGYVPKRMIAADTVRTAHVVSTVSAPVFKRADIKSPLMSVLPMNAKIRLEKGEGPLREIAGLGFIHTAHVRCVKNAAPQDFVDVATEFLGRPYIWGGTGQVGVDCSGLVQMALAATGVDAPRDADQQEAHLGAVTALDTALRGDLVFWAGHVGIMEDAKTLLHANAHHMQVAREPLKKAIQRIGPPRILKRL
ncbi:C40 family peptidase [Litorimonas sp. RW-G-Af-16]|uniref:C40 family peptidase n=1 Tax=Litorimonas sp. RW-G-Af-16 TaxID=3241168 RepID=UPI00390CA228